MVIGELEDAMIARIVAARAGLPYALPTVESYGGQLDDDVQSTFQLPAVFVTFGGEKLLKLLGERSREMEVEFVVYVAAFWVSLATQVKRWHDLDKSGWMALLAIIPLVGLVALICLGAKEGTGTPNRFGAGPMKVAM